METYDIPICLFERRRSEQWKRFPDQLDIALAPAVLDKSPGVVPDVLFLGGV